MQDQEEAETAKRETRIRAWPEEGLFPLRSEANFGVTQLMQINPNSCRARSRRRQQRFAIQFLSAVVSSD